MYTIFSHQYDFNLIFVGRIFDKGGEIENIAYHTRANEVEALVTQFQSSLKEKDKVLEEKVNLLRVYEAKIIDIEDDLVDHTQK